MKKYLIILICALLAFSLISCEKDKSEEMLDTFEAFLKAIPETNTTKGVFDNYIVEDLPSGAVDEKHEYTVDLTKDKGANLDKNDLGTLIKGALATEYDVVVTKWELTTGELKGKIEGKVIKKDGSLEVSVTNAKISCTYDIVDESTPTPIEKDKTLDLIINMKYKAVTVAKDNTATTYMTYSINGKNTDFVMSVNISTAKPLFASINGKKVNLRIFQIIQNLGS